MKAIEAKLPKQSWYPDGYYEVRIAAEAEVAESPGGTEPEPGEPYNLIICDTDTPGLDASDPALRDYGAVALDIKRERLVVLRQGLGGSRLREVHVHTAGEQRRGDDEDHQQHQHDVNVRDDVNFVCQAATVTV